MAASTLKPALPQKRLRTFYTLLFTQFFSLIGSHMTGIAVGMYIFRETGSATPILVGQFFAELPAMLLGSFTGFLADRWDRRWVIMVGDAGQAVASLLLLLSFSSGAFEIWHLYLAMLIQGIFAAIQAPASAASIALLVPEDHRDRANGLREMAFPLAGVIAPVLAGVLVSLIAVEGVIALDLFTFLAAMGVIFMIYIPRPPAEEKTAAESLWQEISGGWRYLRARPALLGLALYLAWVYFLINGPLALALPYHLAITGSESIAGLLLGVFSLGAFAGASALAFFGQVEDRIRLIFWGFILHSLALMLYGVVRHPILLGLAIFWVLFPLPLSGALFNTILQNKTPAAVQGRVFALTGQLFVIGTPFSFLITAWLVDHALEPAVGQAGWQMVAPLVGRDPGAGMGLLLWLVGAIILISTLLFFARRAVRHLERELPNLA